MRYLLLFNFFLIAPSVNAKSFPDWVERNAKLFTYEQLAQWSKEVKPFTLGDILSREEETKIGGLSHKVEVNLQNDETCKERKLATTCLPVGLHTASPALFCSSVLNDCDGKKLTNTALVK